MDIWVTRGLEQTGLVTKFEGAEVTGLHQPGTIAVWDQQEGYTVFYPGEWYATYAEADSAARKRLDVMKKRHERKGRALKRIAEAFYKQHKELSSEKQT